MVYRLIKEDRAIQQRISIITNVYLFLCFCLIPPDTLGFLWIPTLIYLTLVTIITIGNPVITRQSARTIIATKFMVLVLATSLVAIHLSI